MRQIAATGLVGSAPGDVDRGDKVRLAWARLVVRNLHALRVLRVQMHAPERPVGLSVSLAFDSQ